MSYLTKLNVVPLTRAAAQSPIEQRRQKLVRALQEQIEIAKAQTTGTSYLSTRSVWTRDSEGNKKRIQKDRVVRPWWWEEKGELLMCVRYGARILSISGNKRAIKIGSYDQIPGTLNTLISATQAGELDTAITASLTNKKAKA